MWDAIKLSDAIRKQKKKAMDAEPELVTTDARVDMDPMDLYTTDKKAQYEKATAAGPKSNADEKQFQDDAQPAMSKAPMASKVNPIDHGKMAYGTAYQDDMDKEAMAMEPGMGSKYVAGSPDSNEEMGRRFSNQPSVGGSEESEQGKRIKDRKMRLSSYMAGLDL